MRFSKIVTNHERVKNLTTAFLLLKQMADERTEQWRIVYEELDKLRAANERQHHLLTCLEYRHILEHLPPARLTGDATARWQKLWEEIVNKELDLLFQGNPGPRTLTSLFKDKVDKLSGPKKQAVQTEITRQLAVPQVVENIALNINNQPQRVAQDRILYKEWPGYRRGHDLYAELSHSIHNYGDRYKICRTNWPQMDLQMLQWLQPTSLLGVRDDEDVDWTTERRARSIPK